MSTKQFELKDEEQCQQHKEQEQFDALRLRMQTRSRKELEDLAATSLHFMHGLLENPNPFLIENSKRLVGDYSNAA